MLKCSSAGSEAEVKALATILTSADPLKMNQDRYLQRWKRSFGSPELPARMCLTKEKHSEAS